MSSELPADLSRLDAPARLRALEVPLLESTLDPELQRLVAEASEVSGFPIALVSLVTHRVQFFRAQVGLPADLEAARASDRCNSFCQFVVASERLFEVDDATRLPGLPTDLVERYGLRAYAGLPLRVAGQVVGSLCVLDVKPGRLGPEALARLELLAQVAAARLEQLAAQWALAPGAQADAQADAQSHQAWLRVAEARSLLSLGEQFAAGKLSFEQLQRGLGALATLVGALTPRPEESPGAEAGDTPASSSSSSPR